MRSQRNPMRGIGIYIIMILFMFTLFLTWVQQYNMSMERPDPYIYSNLTDDLAAGNVRRIEITGDLNSDLAGTVKVTFKNEAREQETLEVIDLAGLVDRVNAANASHGLEIVMKKPIPPSIWAELIPFLIVGAVFVLLFYFVIQNMQGGGGRIPAFGRSRAKAHTDTGKKVNFGSVAGLEEEKHELTELVDYLKFPKKFLEIGARIPKGVLLVGPPGTGKTLLAKAIAGEAGVPFYSISGSDFVEMFVGVGASRVRDLFEQAKRTSPCMIFIDEIDAVGRRRGAGLGGGHDEREQTLNQLLVEMDGFGVNESVIVIAATNRPDILDPALLRPGRFDRRVIVGPPDIKGREEILNVHANGKKLAEDVDFKVVAQTTVGFTGADLENLLNEAALLAVRNGKEKVDMEELRKAFIKVGIGTEKKSRVITDREKRETAIHESGHAIIQEFLDLLDSVHIVSIIPTGRAGGYMLPLRTEDKMCKSKRYMEQEIVVLLGGRAAEHLVMKDITTGATADIEYATNTARQMVTKYGMSDLLGPVQFGDDSGEVFIGRDWGHTRNYSEDVAMKIDREIKRIIDTSYEAAVNILTEHMDILNAATDLLVEREKITGEEFRTLFPEGVIVKKQPENLDIEKVRAFLTEASKEEKTDESLNNAGDTENPDAAEPEDTKETAQGGDANDSEP